MAADAKAKAMTDKEMEAHREYMRKFQKKTEDVDETTIKYKDHYELLGLPRDASHSDIRKAYRKLALQFHPDRNSSEEAQERWDGIPAAYAVLSSPNERMEYDATLPTRDALVAFYRAYNPAKLDNATIQTIIDGWYGREVELFRMLKAKYEINSHEGADTSLPESRKRLSSERARTISEDSIRSTTKAAGDADITWTESIGSVLCCRSAGVKNYFEVDTKSPGIVQKNNASDTPGQTMDMEAKTPSYPRAYQKGSLGGESSRGQDSREDETYVVNV